MRQVIALCWRALACVHINLAEFQRFPNDGLCVAHALSLALNGYCRSNDCGSRHKKTAEYIFMQCQTCHRPARLSQHA